MNAPESSVAVAALPVAHIAPSPTNPRKSFDKDYIGELAASIQTHGIIQPITVRPLSLDGLLAFNGKRRGEEDPPLYEIVVGECRWRAAQLAGLTEIPAFWRELDDKQAGEIQLVENLKRRDLSPIEEAEGYRRLMKYHGHTADTIATQIGKSRSHVYAQLKLLDLGKTASAALLKGDLDPSRALLIARIPTEKLQEEALDSIIGSGYQEPMSYRRAADYIQNHYMLRLAEAPFPRGDADLVAGAPACADCPKRTGSQPELFADVKSADICTDPTCFAAKKAAHTARVKAEAEARGQAVITGKEAAKLKPSRWSDDLKGDFLALDERCYAEGGKGKTYRQLLGKAAPAPTLLEDPHEPGKLIEILPKATIKEHLEAKGIALTAKRPVNDEQKAREKKAKQESAFRTRLFDAIRSHLTQDFAEREREPMLEDTEHAWVAQTLFDLLHFDHQKRIACLWYGPTDKKQDDRAVVDAFRASSPALPGSDLARLLIEMALVGEVSVGAWSLDRRPERLLAAATSYGINAEGLKKEVAAEFKAKEKPKPAATPKKSAPKASPPTPAAQAQDEGAKAAAPAKAKKPAAPKKPKAKASPAPASPAEEMAPAAPGEAAADDEPHPFAIGTRVRVKDDAKGPNGIKRKCAGREGAIESINGDGLWITVRFGKKAHELVTNLQGNELEIVLPPAISSEPWPFPTGARP